MTQPSLKNTIVLFTGDDTRTISATVQRWKEAFVEKHGEENINEFDDPVKHASDVFAMLLTPSLLGDKRMLILKDFPRKAPKKKEDAEEYEVFEEKFLAILPLITEDTVVLIQAGDYDARKKTTKSLMQASDVREFKHLSLSLDERIERARITISPADLHYLRERIGNDPERTHRDLQKLALFADGASLTREDIDLLIYSSLDVEIFGVLNNLTDPHMAAKKIQYLLDRGHEPLELLGTFIWYFERLAFVSSLMKTNSKEEILEILNMKPFAFESAKRALHTFPFNRIKRAFAYFAQFDRQLKNGELSFSSEDKEEVKLAFMELVLKL